MKRNHRTAVALAAVGLAMLATASGTTADGTGRIAFARGTGPERYSIWTVGEGGAGLHQVTHSCMWDWWPAWSPDGTQIAFSRTCPDGNFDLYSARTDGTAVRRVTHTRANDEWPTWSPDGTRIAFVRGDDALADLYVVRADGTGIRRLTSNRVFDGVPTWAPDGREILFTSKRTGTNTLMLVSLATGRVHSLGVRGGESAFSPDGTRIAFARAVAGAAAETTNVFVARADGTGIRPLTHERTGVVSHHPSWSPDGRRVVFMSNRAAPLRGADLWIADTHTGALRRLTRTPFEDVDPAWEPAPR